MRGATSGFSRAAKNQNLLIRVFVKVEKGTSKRDTNQMLLFAERSPYPEA
jgi:hypothetical protein